MKIEIKKTETFTDCAEIVDIFGQGSNQPTKQGVNGFQVEFDVVATNNKESKSFHVVYQSDERNCNITAYNGYEMSTASRFGCDADCSDELSEFMDYDDEIFSEMNKSAERLCKEYLESNTSKTNKLELFDTACGWIAVFTGETGSGDQVIEEEAHNIAGDNNEERIRRALIVWGADADSTEISIL